MVAAIPEFCGVLHTLCFGVLNFVEFNTVQRSKFVSLPRMRETSKKWAGRKVGVQLQVFRLLGFSLSLYRPSELADGLQRRADGVGRSI